MITQKDFFKTASGETLFLYKWLPDGQPKAVVQIFHGMAEHAARYERLAAYLTAQDFAVYADDHRGHGLTVKDGQSWGVLAHKDGFAKMVEEEKEITNAIRTEFPNTPVFLLGHSMGSFMARLYVAKGGSPVDGLILSGTGNPSYPELIGGLLLAQFQVKIFGRKSPAYLLDHLTFGGYNKLFAPNRTSFDWLSSDEAEVDKYVSDTLCGNVFPLGFYVEFFKALISLKCSKSVKAIPKDLPILFISGEKDPVGGQGKGVRAVCENYQKHGIKNVEIQLFSGGRHELLNEANRLEVMKMISGWISMR